MTYVLATGDASGIDAVIEASAKVMDFAGTMLTEIMEQPVLLFLLAAGFVPVGFKVLRGLKRTARS